MPTTSDNGHRPEEEAARDAMLDALAEEDNVWEYLNRLRGDGTTDAVPPQHRQDFYPVFIEMVTRRPLAEQDALLQLGSGIFHYRLETARKDLAALTTASGGGPVEILPSVVDDTTIADVAYDPETRTTLYLIYSKDTGSLERQTGFNLEGLLRYRPPHSLSAAHLKTRSKDPMVLLPTDAIEYGDAESLAGRVRTFIEAWVQLPDEHLNVDLALAYVFTSWVIERFDAIPYLRALGDWGSGKTRLITVVGSVCQRPTFLAGATTPAPIYRLMDQWRGTLILDEGDFKVRSEVGELLEKIFLNGYKRGFPIPRVDEVNGERDVVPFDCFGMKLTSNRSSYDPALDSRHLSIRMPVVEDVNKPVQLPPRFWADALALRNQLQLWRFRTLSGSLTLDENEKIDGVVNRTREVGLPLLLAIRAITGCTGSVWEKNVIERLKEMSKSAQDSRAESWEGRVALAFIDLYQRMPTANIETKDIRRAATTNDDGTENKEIAERLTQRRVNTILKDTLHLRIIKTNSRQRVVSPKPTIVERLAAVYGVAFRTPIPPRPRRTPIPSRQPVPRVQ
jgi:hypothetical protein